MLWPMFAEHVFALLVDVRKVTPALQHARVLVWQFCFFVGAVRVSRHTIRACPAFCFGIWREATSFNGHVLCGSDAWRVGKRGESAYISLFFFVVSGYERASNTFF